MKNLILGILLLATITMTAQYNKLSVGGEFGIHSVSDQSALVTENFNHYGLDVRYNINELVGAGLRFGFDNIQLSSLKYDYVKMNYGRINTDISISLFEILRLRHKNINFLIHGGPGIAFIDTDNGYHERLMNIAGGITSLVKITDDVALRLDYTSSAHLTQEKTLDGKYDIKNAGINSIVDNLSLGVTIYLGDKKQHADWYVPEEVVVTPVVNHITHKNITEVTKVINNVCECEFREFVFFDHDKYDIRENKLNAINKAFDYLVRNPESKLLIRGFASATKSSAEYNLELSQNRGNAIKIKLVQMGVAGSRIAIDAEGKDYNYASEDIHDMARRVELIVE